mmetsp:Transcript_89537/g.172312  ORF Transcript_89537/g.172312 Transcript_89537/m.172312 type:complete len:384 (-) Transcript_89537:12-1163(-)|eukprot:CAMPEP_0172691972 /NCGR_PEP_ID=MMETSP1074-20121228/24905_1 /TAXON_ID=2916 /ORGANISM="Ceratium fusus, Strain PA161109" /LENGTH=383 /DNA_ID=CAMNT_0013512089 /DNA_START=30 /DNA_END=1181 /DNA_ORIENTATION=+
MGCGASAKTEKSTCDSGSGAAPSDEAPKTDDSSRGYVQAGAELMRDGALNVVGLAGTTGGACVSMIGHGMAAASLTTADILTLGMVDSIGDARDEHFEEMVDGVGDARSGLCSWLSHTDWYRSDPAADDKADWMSRLPDDTPITNLFLPGTHDTLALNGGDLAECQSWILAEQLRAGIRVLDVRPKHDGDLLPIFHGIVRQTSDWGDAVSVLESFITEHPTEIVFLRVKREGECGEHHCDFNDAVTKARKNDSLWNNKIATWGNVGEVRGKIIPLAFGSQLLLYRQPIDCQDIYNTGDEGIKFNHIKEHATKEREQGILYIDFCSAVGMDGCVCFKAPGAVAYEVNKMVWEAMPTFNPGIYFFDFPGNALIDSVISRNLGMGQ